MPRLPKDKFGCVTFVVRGSGSFPLDMLRFDSCAPSSGCDVTGILIIGSDEKREVKLRRFYPVGGIAAPTAARWTSFGWEVREVYP